ncbi:hypothetical protein SARC_08420 [Sphaeroforma arctica JP610]|uniref:Uncharacterized protein n=1 Tax=Sphaeroforma arctica JP610 TaxID=667725 RepID=A0A0L0FQX8_9EUKA|nr:hypothetical protein SARC_08420 [Sphaeroforma arctica JP610]KNC79170.1 hypothetical protein SARC_08420 [Sphaeroforma arctica JP610]|eukprot:XP_014153072.1 hypothetical protein SARC_08420 [Sphaeroforma arctica JP610]
MTGKLIKVVTCAVVSVALVEAACTDDSTYDAGRNQAEVQWNAAWSYKNEDCMEINNVYKQVHKAAPSSPECLNEGFEDELDSLYDDQMEECLVYCEQVGENYAESAWAQATKDNENVEVSSCQYLDAVFQQANRQTPSTPDCLRNSFQEWTNAKYNEDLDDCVDECVGYGENQGENLAQQFCAIAQPLGAELYDEGLTIVICNQQEEQACLDTFDSLSYENCPDVRDNSANDEYYKALTQSCQYTIGPQPSNPDEITCEAKWIGRPDDKPDCPGFLADKECCQWSNNCGDLPKCTASYCCPEESNYINCEIKESEGGISQSPCDLDANKQCCRNSGKCGDWPKCTNSYCCK